MSPDLSVTARGSLLLVQPYRIKNLGMTKHAARPALVLALVLVPASLGAQEPLVTDRPDFTESASSVVPGRVQLEAGATLDRVDDENAVTLGEALFRIGVVPGLEARVGVPSWIDAGEASGLDSGFLGAKAELPAGAGWDLALLVGTTVPIGDDEVASDEWEPEAVLAAGRDLSETTGLGVNLGWGRPSDGEERIDEWRGSVAAGFDLGGGWGAYGEAFGFVTDGDAGPAFLDAGVTRLLGPDLQLDARVGAGLFDAAGDAFVGVGVSKRW